MSYEEFLLATKEKSPPDNISELLKSLWYDRSGSWDTAHRIAQEISSNAGSAVHAYLHRVEGDLGNAGYWYSRAGRDRYEGSLTEEWEALVKENL